MKPPSAHILCALMAFTVARAQAPPATISQATELATARQSLAAKQYTEAERHFRTALTADPNSIPARMGLADAELALHQYQAAELDYRRIVAAQPQLWVAHKNLVIIEAALGRWDEFDRERAVLRSARERGADGISTHESDVIDSFDTAGRHWIVREYFEPVGRSQARYNFESFAPDGRIREYISLEPAQAASAALSASDAVSIGEPTPQTAVSGPLALNWYSTKAHGTIRTYPGSDPGYQQLRNDVQRWLRTNRAGANQPMR